MRTLFLQAPSFDGFDGGAGSRYQAKREITSFWYPDVARPAGRAGAGSQADRRAAPASTLDEVLPHGAAITSSSSSTPPRPPSAPTSSLAEALKDANPRLKIGFVGAHVAVAAEQLEAGAGRRLRRRATNSTSRSGISPKAGRSTRSTGSAIATTARSYTTATAAVLEDLDALPVRHAVYQRDLRSRTTSSATCSTPTSRSTPAAAANRAAPSALAADDRRSQYRTRSVEHVDRRDRAGARASSRRSRNSSSTTTPSPTTCRAPKRSRSDLGKLGVTWSCNAKAQRAARDAEGAPDNGLRLLLVGYESGNQQILHNIKKGMRVDVAQRFTKDCHELGIKIHGTFIIGLPGETGDDRGDDPLRQRDQSAHDPGFHRRALSRHRPLQSGGRERLAGQRACRTGRRSRRPDRAAELSAPVAHGDLRLGRGLLQRFYFRPRQDRLHRQRDGPQPDMMKRRLREGVEFFPFLRERRQGNTAAGC